jgi:hypothetical protein
MDYDDPDIDRMTLAQIADDLKDRIVTGDRDAISELRKVEAALKKRKRR